MPTSTAGIRGWTLDTDHDLDLDAAGRLIENDGDDATYQEIACSLLLMYGENFMDVTEGVPWFAEIFQKGTPRARIEALIRNTIQLHPAIVDVPRVALETDRATRESAITFEARTASGRIIRSQDYRPILLGRPPQAAVQAP
jgi:hypothetical protein